MSSVARRPDDERPVGASAELAIDPSIGLEHDQPLGRVETSGRAHSRNEVGVAGDQHCGVALVATDELQKTSSDRHISLLLFPGIEPAMTQRTRATRSLELPEMDLNAGRLEGREVRDLPGDRAGVLRFAMVSHRREVDDRRKRTSTRQGVQIGATQPGNVEPAETVADSALSIEDGVVQVETVDKEDAAVDGDLPKGSKKRKKAPGSQPRGGHGIYPWGGMTGVWHR